MRGGRALLIGLVLLGGAQFLATGPLAERRPASRLPSGFFQALPPGEQVGLLVLGGFRGLAIDLLWMRAIGAKDDGRFYESVAVFDLISRLQPRFERVWEYMAWDMAYNIAHEMDDADGRWAWFLAGLESNVRGCQLNPQSWRLLKHLAWMLQHRGDRFPERFAAADWRPLFGPLLAPYGADCALPEEGPISAFMLAERCYRAAVILADTAAVPMPAYVRRMVPLMIEMDGHRLANQGQHLAAARRYLACLRAWVAITHWAEGKAVERAIDRRITWESHDRNEGRVRRRLAALIEDLARDPARGRDLAAAVLARDFAGLETALDEVMSWHATVPTQSIEWLDERT